MHPREFKLKNRKCFREVCVKLDSGKRSGSSNSQSRYPITNRIPQVPPLYSIVVYLSIQHISFPSKFTPDCGPGLWCMPKIWMVRLFRQSNQLSLGFIIQNTQKETLGCKPITICSLKVATKCVWVKLTVIPVSESPLLCYPKWSCLQLCKSKKRIKFKILFQNPEPTHVGYRVL